MLTGRIFRRKHSVENVNWGPPQWYASSSKAVPPSWLWTECSDTQAHAGHLTLKPPQGDLRKECWPPGWEDIEEKVGLEDKQLPVLCLVLLMSLVAVFGMGRGIWSIWRMTSVAIEKAFYKHNLIWQRRERIWHTKNPLTGCLESVGWGTKL